MSAVAIAYTPSGGPTYNFVFREFLDGNYPRSHIASTNFDISALGTSILTGAAYQQKRIWAVNALLPIGEADDFETMYRAWDLSRSQGNTVAMGFTDATFGATISTTVVFSTSPTFAKFGPNYVAVAFGVTEL
jgi:hypothetical protein